MHSPLTLCEGGGRGEWGEGKQKRREKENEEMRKKKERKEEEGRTREGGRKKKGEEWSGGWSDSRVHIRQSSANDQIVSVHTSHLQRRLSRCSLN